jgi:hypothetical protein
MSISFYIYVLLFNLSFKYVFLEAKLLKKKKKTRSNIIAQNNNNTLKKFVIRNFTIFVDKFELQEIKR